MDVILDANAYIQVLHNHGRKFLQTNQFAELLTHLRRTGSRLVIPELTYNEVVTRYRDKVTELAKKARDGWAKLQQIGMQERMDFIEPEIEAELKELDILLRNPANGVQSVIYTDYSGVDVKEVVRRGVERLRPANENGEELRDVVLWLVVLQYAKQCKSAVAFVSADATFQQDKEGALHSSLQPDIEQAGVNIVFYRSLGDFVKRNALESELLDEGTLATYLSPGRLQGISTEQLLASRFWDGTIVGADVSRCELVEGKRYQIADDRYYVEASYTGEGTIRLSRSGMISVRTYAPSTSWVGTGQYNHIIQPSSLINAGSYVDNFGSFAINPVPYVVNVAPSVINSAVNSGSNFLTGGPWFSETTETTYKCRFSLRLSLRIVGRTWESLEVDQFALLGELTPVIA